MPMGDVAQVVGLDGFSCSFRQPPGLIVQAAFVADTSAAQPMAYTQSTGNGSA